MKKRTIFIIISVVLIIAYIVVGNIGYIMYKIRKVYLDPVQIVERETRIEFPENTEIINYKFSHPEDVLGYQSEKLELVIAADAKQLGESFNFLSKSFELDDIESHASLFKDSVFFKKDEIGMGVDDIDYVISMSYPVKQGSVYIKGFSCVNRPVFITVSKPDENGQCKALIFIGYLGFDVRWEFVSKEHKGERQYP